MSQLVAGGFSTETKDGYNITEIHRWWLKGGGVLTPTKGPFHVSPDVFTRDGLLPQFVEHLIRCNQELVPG